MVDTAELVVGLVAFGMAVAFVSADPQSPTSRALAGFFGFLGVISFLTVGGSVWLVALRPVAHRTTLYPGLHCDFSCSIRMARACAAHGGHRRQPQFRVSEGTPPLTLLAPNARFYGLYW
jgi:hypothetical protein